MDRMFVLHGTKRILHWLCVVKSYKRGGFGRQLYRESCKVAGCKKLTG